MHPSLLKVVYCNNRHFRERLILLYKCVPSAEILGWKACFYFWVHSIGLSNFLPPLVSLLLHLSHPSSLHPDMGRLQTFLRCLGKSISQMLGRRLSDISHLGRQRNVSRTSSRHFKSTLLVCLRQTSSKHFPDFAVYYSSNWSFSSPHWHSMNSHRAIKICR